MKTPPVTPSAAPAVLVDYQRTGGIAGFDDRMVLFDNGEGVVSSKTRNTVIALNQSDLDHISAVFKEAQFSMLEGNYTSRRGGTDFIQYRISYHGKTVKSEDSATPPSLQLVIDEMNLVMSRGYNAEPVNLPLTLVHS
ncbi:MAG: hypothetical protein WC586_08660 [Methanoregula sp.]